MPPDTQPGSPKDWLKHAESDLKLACIGREPGVLLENLTFHAQQSAEKALNSLLLAKHQAPPRTHNIRFLLDQISHLTIVPEQVQKAALLTDYAVATRYPGNFEPITIEEYNEAIDLAKQVLYWAKGQIEQLQ